MSVHPARLFRRRCGLACGPCQIISHPRAERVRFIRRLSYEPSKTRGSENTGLRSPQAHWQLRPTHLLVTVPCRSQKTTTSRPHTTASPAIPQKVSLSPDSASKVNSGRQAIATRTRQRLVLRSGGFGIPKPHPPSTSPPSPPPTPTSATSWPQSSTNPESLRITHGGTRAVQIGEDAYFFARSSMGVSDGVGGNKYKKRPQTRKDSSTYVAPHSTGNTSGSTVRSSASADPVQREEKEDSARFSQLLMHFCAAEADTRETARNRRRKAKAIQDIRRSISTDDARTRGESQRGSEAQRSTVETEDEGEMDPIIIMQQAYEHTVDCVRTEGVLGSATCLLAVLDGEMLRIANLGDCAVIVVRRGQIVFRTEEMQHGFNFPLQLGTSSKDEPMKDAQTFSIQVEKGDIVVMGSDGLSDNLFDEEILDVLSTFSSPSARNQFYPSDPDSSSRTSTNNRVKIAFTPQRVSEALCLAANSASRDVEGASPFMYKAIDRGYSFIGGKQDDISVVVALVDGI